MSVLFNKKMFFSPGKKKERIFVLEKRTDRKAHLPLYKLLGSISLEAAMVFPIFFFSVWFFWQSFLLILTEMTVVREMKNTTEIIQSAGFAERYEKKDDIEDFRFIYEGAIKAALLSEVSSPASLHSLKVTNENEKMVVTAEVDFYCSVPLFPKMRITFLKNCVVNPYLGEWEENKFSTKAPTETEGTQLIEDTGDAGDEKSEEEDIYVYVTAYGSVYHTSVSCSKLTCSVSEISESDISTARNSEGKKYRECDVCKNVVHNGKVYISASGEKYHYTPQCKSYHHAYTKVKLSELDGMRPCSICGGIK